MVWDTVVTSAIQLVAKANLRRQIRDPWKRRQLTPDFRAGCKRMLMTNDYYPALEKENCSLITWPIAALSPAGIRTADRIEHEVDCIVFATGYDVVCKNGTPFPVAGLDGRKLADDWAQGPCAYKSVSVSGYPNLFWTFAQLRPPATTPRCTTWRRRSTTSSKQSASSSRADCDSSMSARIGRTATTPGSSGASKTPHGIPVAPVGI